MIGRKRVDPGFDIGEVLHKKRSHIRVDLIAIRDRQIGTGATPRFLTFLAPRGLGELAQGKTVPNVPCDARQLAGAVSYACEKAGKWTVHASRPMLNYTTYIRLTEDMPGQLWASRTFNHLALSPAYEKPSTISCGMQRVFQQGTTCNSRGCSHPPIRSNIPLPLQVPFSAYGHPQHADNTTQPITLPVLIPAGQCSSPITCSDEAHRPA